MASVLLGGKKLTDLRVVDLRQELENRGLEKTGVKAVLIERLQKVICRFASKNISNRYVLSVCKSREDHRQALFVVLSNC